MHKMKYPAIVLLVFFVFPLFISAKTLAETLVDESIVIVTVSKTDNLVNICKTWLENPNDWKRVAAFNQLKNPHLIYPGQRIKIQAKLLKGIPIEGFVTFIKGDVWVSTDAAEGKSILKKGDTVGQNAQIETGEKSVVEIAFEDGSTFFLRPDTQVRIKAARQRQPYFIIRKLFMPAGRTMMHIQKSTGGDSRFEIQTPSAVSAARGTQFRVSVDDDEVTRTEVLEGSVGVAGSKKEVILDPGHGTWIEKGAPPNMPQKLLPPPTINGFNPLYQRLPVNFSLIMPQTATAARLILAKDSGMKDIVTEFVVKNGDSVPNIMLPDGEYYCQTLSINTAGLEGLPILPKRFKIRMNPFPPFPQKPANGQELKTKKVEAKWLNVSDAVSYDVQVSRDLNFKTLYKNIQGITGTRTIINLDSYGDYYLRVRSIAKDGFKGLWSDAIFFCFVEPPTTPEAQAPMMDEDTISLGWQGMGPNMTYLFQMAADPLFKDILLEKTTDVSEIRFDSPKKGGTYYVRVKAIDQDGYEGQFTPTQNFEIKGFPYTDVGVMATWLIGTLILIL